MEGATSELWWGDLVVAALPMACMAGCILHALRRTFFARASHDDPAGQTLINKLWIAVLFVWVAFAFGLLFWNGFWSCQDRMEEALATLRRTGRVLQNNIPHELSHIPATGTYAFWPETVWLGNRRLVDYTDPQWRQWRVQLPLVLVGGAIFILLSQLLVYIFKNPVPFTRQHWEELKRKGKLDTDYRCVTEMGLLARLCFYVALGMGVVVYLHGVGGFLRILFVVAINFAIGRIFGASKLNPILTWLWNCTILFTSDYFKGYYLAPLLGPNFLWMDTLMGIVRWAVYFNIAFTRLVSFNMDYYWALNHTPVNRHKSTDLFIRQESHAPPECYGLLHYLAYFFYVPLYLAGPVVPFNCWISQIKYPQQTYSLRQILSLLLRTLMESLALSLSLGYYYYYYIDEHVEIWSRLAPWEIAMTACFTLVFMYMKFLCIWRTFRCWALLDGVDCVDNMSACVYNVSSFADFWRQWHSSLHNWIVRYMYIPMGGAKTQRWTMWIIFIFIGLWHDLWWRWFAWALFNCIFFSMELTVRLYFAKPKWGWLHQKWYYELIAGVPSAICIFCLFIANLAIMHGFANTALFLKTLALQDSSWKTVIMITVTMWAWAQLRAHFTKGTDAVGKEKLSAD